MWGETAEIVIKNQDPPAIRSPSREHIRWMNEVERVPSAPNYLARREVLELCNYLMIVAGDAICSPRSTTHCLLHLAIASSSRLMMSAIYVLPASCRPRA